MSICSQVLAFFAHRSDEQVGRMIMVYFAGLIGWLLTTDARRKWRKERGDRRG